MGEVRVTQDDRILFSFLLGWDVTDNRQRILDGHFDRHVKMQKIARHRQAAEKAQQERDAGICEKVAADWQGKTKLYRSRGNNGPYLGEPTGWSIATAIRSQGHE